MASKPGILTNWPWKSLGSFKEDKLNKYGELYIKRYPQVNIKIVDGSSLVVAIVLHTIPKEATQVLLCGKLTKVSTAIVNALCESGTKVTTMYIEDYDILQSRLHTDSKKNLIPLRSCADDAKYLKIHELFIISMYDDFPDMAGRRPN
ncbi:hypothetical protein PIB30_040427 [Stylosanthes scabra]|uniref:Very-long-chain aldehyde decarbonylase CER1-like C-terminal domain-containing protein n=1 Tax=Stylosanthes scabra TaxID=79078 RepID=A0ABU6SG90_9FABA|nr:hypothetical protein [Stylosanthes scabra]